MALQVFAMVTLESIRAVTTRVTAESQDPPKKNTRIRKGRGKLLESETKVL